ncbi:MAG: HlyD family secretion protein [Gemmatimonadaceae bacterium]
MPQRLLPDSLVEDCVEVHLARHAPSGRALYLALLALVVGGIAALPLVQVPITIQANGVVRPRIERQEARAAESGLVHSVRVVDGAVVDAGDTLITLDATGVITRLTLFDSIARAQANDLADLAAMLAAPDSARHAVHARTAHRQQQLREHAAVERELLARAEMERKETDRLQRLYDRGFATDEQLERQRALRRTALAAVQEHRERSLTTWSDAHARITDELRRLEGDRAGVLESLSRYAVVAPVSGPVELTLSLSPGSVLQRGDRIATISPNADLIGEVLLTPRDVGFLHPGTPARIMVDAFNYRDWGTVEGIVTEISDDIVVAADQPVFRVRFRLAAVELRLPGGTRASIKKGMTFRARFVVADRSLLDLIFDDVDDWLNPARAATSAESG